MRALAALAILVLFAGSPSQAAWGQNAVPAQDGTSEESMGEAPISDSAPPLPSPELVQQFYKACTDVASGDAAALERAQADGWTRYEDDVTTPFKAIFSASKPFAGFEQVELWSSVETYPSGRLGYCRIDLGDYDKHLAFGDFAAIAGLAGSVTVEGEDVYGAWETADHKIMVIADRVGGEFEVEFNLLLPAASN